MPYTYLIGWSKLNQYYYGCRYAIKCNPNDLWVTYFTSSKYVKMMREAHGEPDIIQVRSVFDDRELCVRHEARVLRRIVGRTNFINKNVAGAVVSGNPSPRTKKQKDAARVSMQRMAHGVWYTDGTNMKRLQEGADLPPGWVRGYPDSYKQKIKSTLTGRPGQFKNMRWYNNGIIRARYHNDNVPSGWTPGWKIK
jgi:hypothetical protein